MFARYQPVLRRRLCAAIAVAALLCTASSVMAQQPAPAPAAAPAPLLAFSSDAAIVLFTVKNEGTADFEAFFGKVKDALAKSPKPEYKQMAAGWKLYKVAEGAAPGQTMYAAMVDPAVKSVDYNPLKIVNEVLPDDFKAMQPKISAALVSVQALNLQNVMKMGGM